jgi:hypothetical protein
VGFMEEHLPPDCCYNVLHVHFHNSSRRLQRDNTMILQNISWHVW